MTPSLRLESLTFPGFPHFEHSTDMLRPWRNLIDQEAQDYENQNDEGKGKAKAQRRTNAEYDSVEQHHSPHLSAFVGGS
jgi:hypothetical protein